MTLDHLVPNDPRVEHKFAKISDEITYHYMLVKPEGTPKTTVVLIHGWPDLGMGWRFQVPMLLSMGLQVVVPDMLGYGQTSAPESHEHYTMKKMCGHIAQVIKEVTPQPIILGGHDWGGFFIWRFTMYYPEMVRAVFSLCVPYIPAMPAVETLDDFAARQPNFGYQKQLASGEAEKMIHQTPEGIKHFLNGMYGARTPAGGVVFTPEAGVQKDNLAEIPFENPIVPQDMVDYYVQEYARHGFHGPCNWYRVRELNMTDELPLAEAAKTFQFKQPAMLVMSGKDTVLLPSYAKGQERFFEQPLKSELVEEAGHWVAFQCPDKANKHIRDFVQSVL
ncbi:bifunctional epoxide hydrolase 2 [Apiospora marii]|uniref:Bifunctional epoxide hydrolase 2 n=1 Tax=Apiospora marii TaxID=335849 RepID=A0ABR1R431_9PEZI